MKRLFIDGLGGMAQGGGGGGAFCDTDYRNNHTADRNFYRRGNRRYHIPDWKDSRRATGAGIGAGVARKLEAGHLVIVSAAVVGMIGAFASGIRSGSLFVDGSMVLSGPGEPLGAFVAAYVAIELGVLISGKTKLDIILTPLACIESALR